jgi:hypothetical protein
MSDLCYSARRSRCGLSSGSSHLQEALLSACFTCCQVICTIHQVHATVILLWTEEIFSHSSPRASWDSNPGHSHMQVQGLCTTLGRVPDISTLQGWHILSYYRMASHGSSYCRLQLWTSVIRMPTRTCPPRFWRQTQLLRVPTAHTLFSQAQGTLSPPSGETGR